MIFEHASCFVYFYLFFFNSSSGLSSSGRDLQMTNESSNHLKLLEEKIRDRSREIDKSIVHSMADDEESGSGSGEGIIK